MKVVVNKMMTCSYQSTQSVLDFIDYCGKESRVDADLLDEIHREWVKKKRSSNRSKMYSE